jgi:tetratricopeptide (TPR) repeat protein
MGFLQPIWDCVPGESLGDKLQVISMAGGALGLVAGGVYALYRRRRGTDVETTLKKTAAEVAEIKRLLFAQLATKERAPDGPALSGRDSASDAGLAKDLSAAIDTLAAAGKTRALELLERGDRRTADEALAAKIAELEQARGKATSGEAALYRQRGALAFLEDTHAALRHYAKACELAPDAPQGWNQLGQLLERVGELDAAIAAYEKVLTLGNNAADKMVIAVATSNLGNIYNARGDLARAEEMYCKALMLDEELGTRLGMASSYCNLAGVYSTRGDLARAEEMCRKALKIEEELGCKASIARACSNLGTVYWRCGDLTRAEKMYRKALTLNEELGRKEGMANQLGNLAILYDTHGNWDRAEEMYYEALKFEEELAAR